MKISMSKGRLLAVLAGCKLGQHLSSRSQKDFSWLAGGMLILLGVGRLF